LFLFHPLILSTSSLGLSIHAKNPLFLGKFRGKNQTEFFLWLGFLKRKEVLFGLILF